MVVVFRAIYTKVSVMMLYSLEAGKGVCEYPYPFLCRKCGESGVDGYQFRSHDGSSSLCSRRIYIDGDRGGYVSQCHTHYGVVIYVGAIYVDPVFRDVFWCPRM